MKKKGQDNTPNVKRENWKVKEISEEGSNEMNDEVLRKTLRGDDRGDADGRDIVGSVDSSETPQGREEAKKDQRRKTNKNG